jgi:large subunit ribosomal protein L25
MGSEKENVLIKAVQYDYLSTTPVHVDLARVDLNEVVTVTVPVNLRGTPAGVKEGGSLSQPVTDIEISCVVVSIPDEIKVRIDEMKIGDTLHASDLALPEGAKLITPAETVIASVSVISDEPVAAEGEGAEAGAEPEVISKGKEETEEETKA